MPEAEAEIRKVQVFIRKQVRACVEKEATQVGKTTMLLNDVKATQDCFV